MESTSSNVCEIDGNGNNGPFPLWESQRNIRYQYFGNCEEQLTSTDCRHLYSAIIKHAGWHDRYLHVYIIAYGKSVTQLEILHISSIQTGAKQTKKGFLIF